MVHHNFGPERSTKQEIQTIKETVKSGDTKTQRSNIKKKPIIIVVLLLITAKQREKIKASALLFICLRDGSIEAFSVGPHIE